ncbi:mitogen-activated protein kinase kinase kinase SSK1 [Saccharomyces paradoxus]|uniref:Mitogen-activated protein kinase kinase kinase SSK1 n=1 Tax=Saccharomyces paradoxus TaxID=27291 RepID=A0A8B8UVI7_SACPA|nr:Ssk1 [Saccharomyces paradoxus]QHS74752.1 Ssk1 [Saccharomyces paradoxus]
MLNSALLWKVWLRIDNSTDEVNQPISVQFDEIDTVDDLKSRFFQKLSSTRWREINDNASIAIGLYAPKLENQADNTSSNNNNDTSCRKKSNGAGSCVNLSVNSNTKSSVSPTTGTFGLPKDLAKDRNVLQHPKPTQKRGALYDAFAATPTVAATSNADFPPNEAPMLSPQRPYSTSPKQFSATAKSPLLRFASVSPYPNFHSDNQIMTSTGLAYVSPHNKNKYTRPLIRKGLNCTTESVDDCTYKIIFEPDELAINIYKELFGTMGSQSASQPLLIFSNVNLRQDVPPLDILNVEDYVPTNEEISQQAIQSTDRGVVGVFDLDDQISLGERSPKLRVNDKANLLDKNDNSNLQKFKLITDEEQLRRASQELRDEEKDADSPWQAILLLPKGYKGGVDFRNKPVANTDSSFNNEDTVTHSELEANTGSPLQESGPLNESGIGIMQPIPEGQRRKDNVTPSSPILTNSQTPHCSNSLYNAPFAVSSPPDPLPNLFTTTSEKVFPKINVLIVEDNVINQAILGSFLRKHKISYKLAKNGQEAVNIWKEGGLHLIFMDLQLPVLSGIEAAKQIRDSEKQNGIGIQKSPNNSHSNIEKGASKRFSQAPVIIVALTASNSQMDKRKALLSGCNDYLTKPVNLHWLSKKITEWGCMQALIDFDSWKQGESRMTDSVLVKSPQKPIAPSNPNSFKQATSMTPKHSPVRNNSNLSPTQIEF